MITTAKRADSKAYLSSLRPTAGFLYLKQNVALGQTGQSVRTSPDTMMREQATPQYTGKFQVRISHPNVSLSKLQVALVTDATLIYSDGLKKNQADTLELA